MSEEELYELTSSTAHSLNNVAMNMITLNSMMDIEPGVDDISNIKQGIISTGEKVIYISSAFSLLTSIHETAKLTNDVIVNNIFNLQDFYMMLTSIENYFEDVFEYKIDIKEDACTSIDSEALKYAILNAISYLRYSFQNHKLNVLVGDIESAAGGIQCIVSYKHQDTAEHTSTSSKKNCNLIALQNFQKINPCFEFVLNNDNSLKMFFMMNQAISSE